MIENIGYDVRDKKFFARKKLQRQKSFTLISSYLYQCIQCHRTLIEFILEHFVKKERLLSDFQLFNTRIH